MTIHFTPEQERQFEQLAADSGRTVDEVVQHFLRWWFGPTEELAAAVREGEESAEREGWLTNDQVFERLNRRLADAK
jgi:hypothetical protein